MKHCEHQRITFVSNRIKKLFCFVSFSYIFGSNRIITNCKLLKINLESNKI